MTNSERLIVRDFGQLIRPSPPPRRNIVHNELSETASDDSGVGGVDKVKEEDVSIKLVNEERGTKTGVTSNQSGAVASNGGRRNKRKSAEPKRRGELLLTKRFQWALNDETDVTSTAEVAIPICSAEDADRPSSGDSGCHSYDGTRVIKGKLKPEVATKFEKPIDLVTRTSVGDNRRKSVIEVPRVIKEECLEQSKRLWKCQNSNSVALASRSVGVARSRKPDLIVSRTTNSINSFRAPSVELYERDVVILSNPRTISESNRRKEFETATPASQIDPGNRSTVPSDPDTLDEGRPSSSTSSPQKSQPRSYYKSMSRQRRVEANARERTRVHTISAAFENLRRAVPAYADSQKLSKLAILKIASSYILALACLNEMDYSKEQRQPDLAECVELCTQTIQSEGKARRRGTKD